MKLLFLPPTPMLTKKGKPRKRNQHRQRGRLFFADGREIPGVSRLTRLLRRPAAILEVGRFLDESGLAGVGAPAWAEVVPQEPLKRKTYRQVEAEDPLPAWVVVDEGKPVGVCIVASCGAAVVTRRLCGAHDRKARAQGIRERIGPGVVVKARGVWR
jgi:hypothetical protein